MFFPNYKDIPLSNCLLGGFMEVINPYRDKMTVIL